MADVVMSEYVPCEFDVAWRGKCRKPSTNGLCSEHEGLKCASCEEEATRSCTHDGIRFVCVASLCDTCEHGLVLPGEGIEMFSMGGGHVTSEVRKQQTEKLRLKFQKGGL